jgi:hypothetical protein
MEDFKPDGEFKAVVVAEETKDYRGDPYEKMMAFLYLGLLDYQAGEYEKALASFKTAALADAGTREEKYRGDSFFTYMMMARTNLLLGEENAFKENLELARQAVRFRDNVSCASQALADGARLTGEKVKNFKKDDIEPVKKAYQCMLRVLSASATDTATPKQTLQRIEENTLDYLASLGEGKTVIDKTYEFEEELKIESEEAPQIARYTRDIIRIAIKNVGRYDTYMRRKHRKNLIENISNLTDPKSNVLVIVEAGRGPYKFRAGPHGCLAVIGRNTCPIASCTVTSADVERTKGILAEDVYYQASTRGGREMDGILRGKAYFKDATAAGAELASELAKEISNMAAQSAAQSGQMAAGPPEAALVLQGISVALKVISATTNPEADIRVWDFLPDRVIVCALNLPPGRQPATIRFCDSAGNEITRYRQTLTIPVLDGQDTVCWLRLEE